MRGCCVGATHKEGLAVVAISPSLSYPHFATPTPIKQPFGRPLCSVVWREDELAHSLSHSPSQWGCSQVYMGLSMEPYRREPAQAQARGRSHFHTEKTPEAAERISESLSMWRQPWAQDWGMCGLKAVQVFWFCFAIFKGTFPVDYLLIQWEITQWTQDACALWTMTFVS